MIYKLESVNPNNQGAPVEFEVCGDETHISINAEEMVGGYSEVSTEELIDLLALIRAQQGHKDECWVKPMSKAIMEVLEHNGITVACRHNMDDVTFKSITLEIINLVEVLKNTGKVPEVNLFQDGG
jgi:hypothetical protein